MGFLVGTASFAPMAKVDPEAKHKNLCANLCAKFAVDV